MKKPMNILLVFSDQQHKEAIGAVNGQYKTPNLDKLCKDGILFENAYSPNPICGPYRGCLMSGQYTSRCKVIDNGDALLPDTVTLASCLKGAGYETAYVGKWHIGNTGNIAVLPQYREGFSHFKGYQCYNGFEPSAPHNNDVLFFDENEKCHSLPIHRTDATTALALEELRGLSKQEKPFMLAVSYQAPHYPEQPSAEFAKLYENTVFDLRKDYEEIDPYTQTYSPPSAQPKELCPDYQAYGNDIQKYTKLYAGLCSQVDAGVGKLIDTLKALDLYENTLIIYTSDHGDMQGSRGLKNKSYPYEMSCGVPFIVRDANVQNNLKSKELISALDIYPTVANIAGAKLPQNLDGVDVNPYLLNESSTTQDYVISEFFINRPYKWRMIRTKQFKLITDASYKVMELYDMLGDEFEKTNLCKNEDYQAVISQMLDILIQSTEKLAE